MNEWMNSIAMLRKLRNSTALLRQASLSKVTETDIQFSPCWAHMWAFLGLNGKESACNAEDIWSLGQEDPLEEEMATTPVFLPGKFHGQRSLAGYSPSGHKESNPTSTHRTKDTGNLSWSIIFPAWLAMSLWLASGKLINFPLFLCLSLQLGSENTDWSSSSEPGWR